jgi:hypothetical protein
MVALPVTLYGVKEALEIGGIARSCGYLMRLRVEYLLGQPEGALGLRRALHACMLSEIVHNTYQTGRELPRADRLFGLFKRELGWKVLERLAASKATLLPDELHFADLEWWKDLDGDRSRQELLSNLERMFQGEESSCLLAGVELHILLDTMMSYKYGDMYDSIRRNESLTQRPLFVVADERIGTALRPQLVA